MYLFYFKENILSEKLAHENEIEKLQQEIALIKEANAAIVVELNTELPINENKLKESNSSNHVHDDDEMVS